jgi:hypothetical protein
MEIRLPNHPELTRWQQEDLELALEMALIKRRTAKAPPERATIKTDERRLASQIKRHSRLLNSERTI